MSKYRHILLTGVEFNNQGAYLMMQAAAQQVRERFGAVPVVSRSNGTRDQKGRAGVLSLVPMTAYRKTGKLGISRFSARVGNSVGMVFPSEIDAVFDASGFAYADDWKSEPLSKRADYLEYWSSNGIPVYMLPQAFGPFEHTGDVSSRALRSARMVIARDEKSLRYVQELDSANRFNVVQYPDFTCGVKGRVPRSHASFAGRVPVIPNWNIYSRTAEAAKRDNYINNLARITEVLHQRGLKPFGLSHEGEKDVSILKMVQKRVSGDLQFPIVQGLDGIELKGLIGAAPLVVSGRFHAIVSALSQATPALIHGWSHKYKYLAQDFQVSDLMADPLGDLETNLEPLERILLDPRSSDLSVAANKVSGRVEDMWKMIEKDLRSVS